MYKRNYPDKNEASTGCVKETPCIKMKAACVRETPPDLKKRRKKKKKKKKKPAWDV